MRTTALFLLLATSVHLPSVAAEPAPAKDDLLARHFEHEVARIEAASPLGQIKSADEWKPKLPEWRRQMREMLGLDPLPERTNLRATVTGTLDADGFTVERLHFQSRPGLYVTANLYVPKDLAAPAPAVLYLCGHGEVKRNGIAYGNKVHYQHHAIRLARLGFVCLVIDTLQLGEIAGIHHGTHRMNLWWWISRGYTPAGVETWNAMRALDYLQSRKEIVDPARIGVAGRSGGGAYSWYLAALDERVKAAVPAAGITDLRNHVVDGAVTGHCDCMYMLNTYRWDFPQLAALAAPRAVLLQNSDKDRIFPLDGVMRTFWATRDVYGLLEAGDRFAPTICEGGHKDTPELQVAEIRWLRRHLMGKDDDDVAWTPVTPFEPEQLKVFAELPPDAINARVHETFVPAAPTPPVPTSKAEWGSLRDGLMSALTQRVFRGWPAGEGVPPLDVREVARDAYEFTSRPGVRLRLAVVRGDAGASVQPGRVVLHVGDVPEGEPERDGAVHAYVTPPDVPPGSSPAEVREQTHLRRRFPLVGQTVESVQVWDVRRAVQALRNLPHATADRSHNAPLWIEADGPLAGVALYASLFEPDIAGLDLRNLPHTHADGPHFPGVLRFLDMPAAVALAAERSAVRIHQPGTDGWAFPAAVATALGWDGRVTLHAAGPESP